MVKRLIVLLSCIALAAAAGGCTVLGSTYEKKVKEADDTARELNALKVKHQALSAEHEALKARAAQLQKELGERTSELAQTKEQRDQSDAKAKELDDILKSKSDQLSQIITDLRAKVADLEARNAKLKADVDALQKAVDEKNRRIAELETSVASLQKAKEEVQQKSKTYADLVEKMKGEIAQGQVTISELKGKLTLNMVDAILFDSGKAEVKPEGQEILKKVVSIVKDVKDKAIRVEGHTDNVQIIGMLAKKYPTNWELSAARALNVTRYLQEQGIDPATLSAVAYGEYKPVAPNDTPEGKQKNRRIEIILVPKE